MSLNLLNNINAQYMQRSALTYWEDEIPSRIDLRKRKYGGPFTIEEVENVKTFLQLLKVLLSLSGILVISFIAQLNTFEVSVTTAPGSNNYMLIMAGSMLYSNSGPPNFVSHLSFVL